MKIFPAIDIKDGRVVRLKYGDYQQMEVYSLTPGEALEGFRAAGADNVHIVDLDGAKDGRPGNFDAISPLVTKSGFFTEVGGGIRNMETVDLYLQAGAGRVILGTAALKDEAFLLQAVERWGKRIAVGVDARDGKVATEGWLHTSDTDSFDFCARLRDMGVGAVIYTDISRDGAMSGCNLEAYARLAKIEGLDIVASGGISTLKEICVLRDMGIYGAILGKALYSGALELADALAAAKGEDIC